MNRNRCLILGVLFCAIFGLPACFHEERQVITLFNYNCDDDGRGRYITTSYAVYPLRQE